MRRVPGPWRRFFRRRGRHLFLPAPLSEALALLTCAAAPREACGALLGRRTALGFRLHALRAGPNLHPQPCSGFELDPGTVVAAEHEARALGLERIGFFHSHPAGPAQPSPADRAHAWAGELALIVGRDAEGRPRARAFRTGRGGWSQLAIVSLPR